MHKGAKWIACNTCFEKLMVMLHDSSSCYSYCPFETCLSFKKSLTLLLYFEEDGTGIWLQIHQRAQYFVCSVWHCSFGWFISHLCIKQPSLCLCSQSLVLPECLCQSWMQERCREAIPPDPAPMQAEPFEAPHLPFNFSHSTYTIVNEIYRSSIFLSGLGVVVWLDFFVGLLGFLCGLTFIFFNSNKLLFVWCVSLFLRVKLALAGPAVLVYCSQLRCQFKAYAGWVLSKHGWCDVVWLVHITSHFCGLLGAVFTSSLTKKIHKTLGCRASFFFSLLPSGWFRSRWPHSS